MITMACRQLWLQVWILINIIYQINICCSFTKWCKTKWCCVFKPKDETGGDVQLTDSQRNQILNDLNQRFQGPNNAGRPMLLEGDFDWKSMGMSPKDMDFTSLKNFSARDIALVYGVPSQLVGVPDSQTYSNLAEARLALYRNRFTFNG